jgi:hypothetical protein
MEDYQMSNLTTAEVPGQGVGTPAVPASSATQSQSAVTQAQEQASQQGTDAKPVTAQDLASLREEMKREIQSQADKRDTRVQARLTQIDQAVKTLRDGGQDITDETVKALKAKAATEAMIEPAPEPIAQPNDPFDTRQWPQQDPVTRKVIQLQAQAGITIKGDMPEAALIVRNGDPIDFYESYKVAVAKAKDRMSASTQTQPKPSAPSAARLPATGTSGTVNKTGRQLLENAHK